MDTKELGKLGEDLACGYLVGKGYKILGRNCRINFGEIDIIAKKSGLFKDKTIHFVEVKTLSHAGNFFPEQRVDYKKQNKYKKLVEVWMDKNKFSRSYPCQVDIIAVTMGGEKPKIDYFENIVNGN